MRLALGSLLLLAASSARADDRPPPTPFDRGRFGVGVSAGEQNNFGTSYFVVGAGVGYYVLDGLAPELSALHEFGSGPSISKVSPGLRYVAQPLVGKSPVVPYVGAFYGHWFIGGGNPDVDTVGGRAGLIYVSGSIVFGLGVVVERTVSTCTTSCTSVYPDLIISLSL